MSGPVRAIVPSYAAEGPRLGFAKGSGDPPRRKCGEVGSRYPDLTSSTRVRKRRPPIDSPVLRPVDNRCGPWETAKTCDVQMAKRFGLGPTIREREREPTKEHGGPPRCPTILFYRFDPIGHSSALQGRAQPPPRTDPPSCLLTQRDYASYTLSINTLSRPILIAWPRKIML